jgi:ABC-2 type transport system permease protein
MRPGWQRCFRGVVEREFLRFLRQRSRFFASLVRPLVWLVIFGTGFHSVLGVSRIPPYDTYVLYEEYIVPGLVGLILLFNGMQTALSMVFDREMGSMKVLLVSPQPRWYLLTCRLVAGVIVAVPQVYAFLACAWLWGIRPPPMGYLYALPAVIVSGLMLGAIGLLVSSVVEQLENFAGVMNFVIFPMFFASTALYPLWRLADADPVLATVAWLNPFSHAVELVRFALYGQVDSLALEVTVGVAVVVMALAAWRYDSGRILRRQLGTAAT